MENTVDYLCLSCGAYDQGKYCSQCGALLPVELNALPELLTARLVKTGFEVFEEGVISTNLDETTRKFFQQMEEIFDTVLLRLDMQGQIGNMTVIGLLSVKANHISSWNEIFSEICQLIPQQAFHLTDKKVKRLEVKVYRVDNSSNVNNIMNPKASISLSLGQRLLANVSSRLLWSLHGIEVRPEQSFVGGNNWTDIDRSQFVVSLKQLASAQETSQPRSESILRDIAHVAYAKTVKEIYNFTVKWYQLLSRPFYTASRLRLGEMSGIEALTFMLGSYGFGVILSGILGYNPSPFDIYPVINDLLSFLFLLAMVAISALMLHPCFKICHGKGRWRDTLLGLVLVTGLIIPFVFLFDALLSRFIGPDALNKVNYEGAFVIYSVPVFSAMHQISPGRTFLALIVVPLVIVLPIVFLVFEVMPLLM